MLIVDDNEESENISSTPPVLNIAHCEGKTRNLNHYFIIFACNLIFFASDSQGEEVGVADDVAMAADVIEADNDADDNNGESGNTDNAGHETSVNAGTQVKIFNT